MLITGIGYCTLHSSCGTYVAIEQDTQYPLGRHFFIQVLFGACVSVSGSAHCTVATHWAKTGVSTTTGPALTGPRRAGGSGSRAVPPCALSSALMTSIFT